MALCRMNRPAMTGRASSAGRDVERARLTGALRPCDVPDDLIESASQSPMVLLRARVLLTTLLNAAPAARQPPIARRLHRTEELGAANFPVIWHDATGTAPPVQPGS
jgi:hypothetical protein